MIKPLIVFANAYDCYPAIDSLRDVPCDQLHVNYYPYPENYIIAEKFFEEHTEYTHILYLAPDMVFTKEVYELMIKELEKKDYDVYGCCFNVDKGKYENRLACCTNLPHLKYEFRKYVWLSESLRQHLLNLDKKIIQVKFNGGFHFVKRELKNRIKYTTLPYETDERPVWETRGGYACDLAFSHWLDYLKIPLYVDLRYKVEHLRYHGELQVGKKEPNLQFFKYDYTNDKLCPTNSNLLSN